MDATVIVAGLFFLLVSYVVFLQAKVLRLKRSIKTQLRGHFATGCLMARLRDLSVRKLKEGGRLNHMETREVAGTLNFMLGGVDTSILLEKARKSKIVLQDEKILSNPDGSMPTA